MAEHFAAIGLDDRRRVALECLAEGVIGGDEEPSVAAGLHNRLSRCHWPDPGVIGPMDRVGVAFGPVRSDVARAWTSKTLFFVA